MATPSHYKSASRPSVWLHRPRHQLIDSGPSKPTACRPCMYSICSESHAGWHEVAVLGTLHRIEMCCCHAGISTCTGDAVVLPPQPGISRALQALGLQQALGAVRLLQLDASSAAVHADEVVDAGNVPALRGQEEGGAQAGTAWVPLQLLLGLPLAPQALCADVCRSGSGCEPAAQRCTGSPPAQGAELTALHAPTTSLMVHSVNLHQLVTGLHPLQ